MFSLKRKKKGTLQLHEEQVCMVGLLDDSDPMHCPYVKDTKGQFLLDHVCNMLNLLERDYFGLRFVDGEKQRQWLDPAKYVSRQMRGPPPHNLAFRVKFYPADPSKLKEELSRYLLFLQLKKDLLHGRLICSREDLAELGAYIIQAALGNHDPLFHLPGYASEFLIGPKQTERVELRMEELHHSLTRGLTASQAEAYFLNKAKSLETYGVDPHPVKDLYGTQILIGITFDGISLFENNRRVQLFKWIDINKVSYEGRTFFIHAMFNHKKVNHGYKSATTSASKHLWKCAIEHQAFFKFKRSSEITVQTSGGFFLKARKFRYTGRTEREAVADRDRIIREAPEVRRIPPKLQPRRASSFKDRIYKDFFSDPHDKSSQPAHNADEVTPVYNETFDLAHDEPGMEDSKDTLFSGAMEEVPPTPTFDEIPVTKKETKTETKKKVTIQTPVQKSSKCATCFKVFFSLVFILLITAISLMFVALESDLEHEYLDEIRNLPEFRMFRDVHYVPSKRFVIEKCYIPSKQWLIRSWHIFNTQYVDVFIRDYYNVFVEDYFNVFISERLIPAKDKVVECAEIAFDYIKAKEVNPFKRVCEDTLSI
ncbi:FERM domain-containing protein 5-like isoform X2 [Ptychodera flava]|uniref:FERM domain-containing protein 5-like isoform X2 n=1 Tax=Ptychodera flava TaxID=63121 RepID=UPI003969C5F2